MTHYLRPYPRVRQLPSESDLLRLPTPEHRFGSYELFLKNFQDRGYQSIFFHEISDPHKQLILRHDIDFDTNLALQTALVEAKLGIKATYFFLVRSGFYNILSQQDFENINLIREMGHTISVHFDPTIYDDFHKGLHWEVALFENLFQAKVDIISLHRPNEFFQNYDAPIHGIEHTYQSRYFRDIKYISDSTGVWRFGHPFDSEEFKQKKSLHVLIHPIWWMLDGPTNLDKLRLYYAQRVQAMKSEFSDNCLPFRYIHESL